MQIAQCDTHDRSRRCRKSEWSGVDAFAYVALRGRSVDVDVVVRKIFGLGFGWTGGLFVVLCLDGWIVSSLCRCLA